MINNRPSIADYVVILDHEGGKSYLQHRNKVAVFQALSGDSVMSHSTLSLGNSVKDACEGIDADWTKNGAALRAAAAKQAAPPMIASAPAPTVAPTAVAIRA